MGIILKGFGLAFVVLVVYYLVVLAGALIAAPLVMWAWNGSLALIWPNVFPTISYWIAYWLSVLSGLLIKSTLTNNGK